jgi:hypothetical protein
MPKVRRGYYFIVGRIPFAENSTYVSEEPETEVRAIRKLRKALYEDHDETQRAVREREGSSFHLDYAVFSETPLEVTQSCY